MVYTTHKDGDFGDGIVVNSMKSQENPYSWMA